MDSTCIDPRDISYRPTAIADPPGIALVACGGITRAHCQAYAAAGYQVRVMCDLDLATAEARRDEFYPHATATTDLAASLARDDIAIVDIAAHPDARPALIRAALEAGKHVLSQKPFVTDLDLGEELCQLAEQRGLKLAVNQNGRWAPHWQWTRNAVAAGLIGPVHSCNFALSWDHNGVADNSAFNRVQHIILYDFAIHWFDICTWLMDGKAATSVTAHTARGSAQRTQGPLLAQALIDYGTALASFSFSADCHGGNHDQTTITGADGLIHCHGPDLNTQQVSIQRAGDTTTIPLDGHWFPDGFHGTMAELMRAIAADDIPSNNARDNLTSLALTYAAMASADRGEAVQPGTVRSVVL